MRLQIEYKYLHKSGSWFLSSRKWESGGFCAVHWSPCRGLQTLLDTYLLISLSFNKYRPAKYGSRNSLELEEVSGHKILQMPLKRFLFGRLLHWSPWSLCPYLTYIGPSCLFLLKDCVWKGSCCSTLENICLEYHWLSIQKSIFAIRANCFRGHSNDAQSH